MDKIAIMVPAQVIEPTETQRTIASKAIASTVAPVVQAQPDLMFMKSILVSTGGNANDDVFLPSEMWKARSTPSLKPVDWEHNTGKELTEEEKKSNPGKVIEGSQTIGVMYNSYAVDDENKAIAESITEVPEKFHLVDEAVIWKGLYPSVAESIAKGAQENNLFVSMEAWFTDYDYLVGNKIIARNEETAFLDKSLRAYGGVGTFGGSRVKRILRNITFGGKGIVAKPANKASVIQSISTEPTTATASEATEEKTLNQNILGHIQNNRVLSSREEINMSTPNTTPQPAAQAPASVPLEQFTKAHDETVTVRAELAKATEKAVDLQKQVEAQTANFSKAAKLIDEVIPGFSSRVSAGNPENFFATLAEQCKTDKAAAQKLDSDLKAALAKIAKIEADAKAAARLARIESAIAGIADEVKRKAKKDKLVASTASLEDAAFDSVLETIAETVKESIPAPVAPAPVATPVPAAAAQASTKVEPHKDAKTMAALLGLPESQVSAALVALDKKDDEPSLESVLASVKPSERAPSAGENQSGAPDLRSAFASLVGAMLDSNKSSEEVK